MQIKKTKQLYFTYSIMGPEPTISTMEQNLGIITDTVSGHLREFTESFVHRLNLTHIQNKTNNREAPKNGNSDD